MTAKKIFQLFDGRVINIEKNKINVFEFTKLTLILLIIQVIHSCSKITRKIFKFLFDCVIYFYKTKNIFLNENLNCNKDLKEEIYQELFKRFYKPLYIPVIALLCCFIITNPKNNFLYKKNKRNIFLTTFILIIISEGSLRYSALSFLSTLIYFIIPWFCFLSIYFMLHRKTKNV